MKDAHRARRGARANDEALILRCLQLAARAEGRTRPNPMVGSVVARGGRVVGEAWHRRAGAMHAERAALKAAGRAARGATLYANLEPCCHWGRTPPCVDAIVAAGIRRVVVSHVDPDPRVDGKGLAALRRAGIRVTVGTQRNEALRLNERHVVYHTTGRPFVLVKAAVSVDGRIAARDGSSRWISSPASRSRAHRLRAAHDALLIGAGTARADDPRLTVRGARLPASAQPLRVVVDGGLTVPPGARMFRERGGEVLVYAVRRAPCARARRLERAGARVAIVAAETGRPDRVLLRACLQDLARRGVTSVMVEGGAGIIASLLRDRLVDRMVLFMAPLIVGGDGVPLARGAGAPSIGRALRLASVDVSRSGPDLVLDVALPRKGR